MDLESYMLYSRHEEEEDNEFDEFFEELATRCRKRRASEEPTPISRTRTRSKKKILLEYVDDYGNVVALQPKQTLWYLLYYKSPDLSKPKFHKKFRRRFRMPHAQFMQLLQEFEESEYFACWKSGRKDAVGDQASPLPLLILGAMRYLGRGWTFDDIEENTAISEETHRQFFHVFIEYGSTVLYERYVIAPTTAEEAAPHMHEMSLAGFHGCCGSSDATHVMMEQCAHRLKQMHKGPKLPLPARTYNITVNHRRRILHTTTGHPSRWNDKTLQLFDVFMLGVNNGTHLSDVEFDLYDTDPEGNVIKIRYRGGWIMVDNGYLSWSTTVPPYKLASQRAQIRWSEWLESLRKDVECTFGILKGRWRLLKTAVRLRGVEKCDKVWKTCCAFHNMLLEVDGLDENWTQGVPSEWEGELGQFDTAEEVNTHALPFAIQRLHGTQPLRQFDLARMGQGNDRDETAGDDLPEGRTVHRGVAELDETGARVVRHLSLDCFRGKLVKHFDILFQRKELQWPSRNGR
jgi:hypothetical protein